jgi:hypothetical protein
MTTSFDTVTIPNASPEKPKLIGSLHFEIEITGLTDDYTDITALSAKAGRTNMVTLLSGVTSLQTSGTKGTLVLEDGQTITNCAIVGDIDVEELPGGTWWKYKTKFVKDYAA